MELPLKGLRILDLTRLLPGPFCTLLLADIGADVVKLEAPEQPDYLRFMPPMRGNFGAMFFALNRNKRAVALDLKKPAGAEAFERLLGRYDILIEGFRPGVMDRLGLGYDELRKSHPSLIMCSISGFGADGPYSQMAGHDINYSGISGILGLTGESASGRPVIPAVQVSDLSGAFCAAIAVLAAAFERERTGSGRYVDVSLTESALSMMVMHLGRTFFDGVQPRRGEERLTGGIPCYNSYRTSDGGYISLGAIEPKFWEAFCRSAGREDLLMLSYEEGEAGAEVMRKLAAVFETRTRREWMDILKGIDCCCFPAWENVEEIKADSQFSHRGVFFEVDAPDGGRVTQSSAPSLFARGADVFRRPAPLIGEHTREVLEECGFSAGEIDRLESEGIAKSSQRNET